jgi:hypothetical protein
MELVTRLRTLKAGEYFSVPTPYQRQTVLRIAQIAGINIHTERAGKAFRVHRLAD